MSSLIDQVAKEIALRRWALPECLHVPIAAVDEAAIRNYIGEIEQVLSSGSPPKAFLVKAKPPPPIDSQLPIWQLAASNIFFQRRQVWVHTAFGGYRKAYKKAFPEENIDGRILSHAMNRRTAALKGFAYVRITPTSRGCNSSREEGFPPWFQPGTNPWLLQGDSYSKFIASKGTKAVSSIDESLNGYVQTTATASALLRCG